jgi:hypothetical protein
VDGVIYKKERHVSQFGRGNQPCTPDSLLKAAFLLLGERYAWGDSCLGIFGRDCSRLAKDVYAVTGVVLPRNGDQQAQVGRIKVLTPDLPPAARRALITTEAIPGDLLITPGHVMIYLGAIDGEPYVIHDKGGRHMCILVSTLDLGDSQPSLLEKLTHLVRVGLG